MENNYYTILDSLTDGSFLETDGSSYWLVDETKYKQITKVIFKTFIEKKLVYAKRIDDETTRYYRSDSSKELIQPDSSKKYGVKNYRVNKIKNFINI